MGVKKLVADYFSRFPSFKKLREEYNEFRVEQPRIFKAVWRMIDAITFLFVISIIISVTGVGIVKVQPLNFSEAVLNSNFSNVSSWSFQTNFSLFNDSFPSQIN